MPSYRRVFRPGGTFFFTLVTENRATLFTDPVARHLRGESIRECRCRRPFTTDAMILLPDHLHLMLTLPPRDEDYPTRIAAIKVVFTRRWLAAGGCEQIRSASRLHHRRRGVWQRHFWEHAIADGDDYERHLDYIRYNAVKHGQASCPHLWPYSTFERFVRGEIYEPHWQCACDGQAPRPPDFSGLELLKME